MLRVLLSHPSTTAGIGRAKTLTDAAPTKEDSVTANQETRTLRFADGNGNVYSFTSTDGRGRLVYSPVTSANSSSGLYSGGEAVDVEVNAEKNTELWNRAKLLQGDKNLHAAGRSMGTGSFQIVDPDGKASFLVSMGPQLYAFAEFAQGLRSP